MDIGSIIAKFNNPVLTQAYEEVDSQPFTMGQNEQMIAKHLKTQLMEKYADEVYRLLQKILAGLQKRWPSDTLLPSVQNTLSTQFGDDKADLIETWHKQCKRHYKTISETEDFTKLNFDNMERSIKVLQSIQFSQKVRELISKKEDAFVINLVNHIKLINYYAIEYSEWKCDTFFDKPHQTIDIKDMLSKTISNMHSKSSNIVAEVLLSLKHAQIFFERHYKQELQKATDDQKQLLIQETRMEQTKMNDLLNIIHTLISVKKNTKEHPTTIFDGYDEDDEDTEEIEEDREVNMDQLENERY